MMRVVKMRINQLLRKKRLPDDLFSPKRAICLQDDISQHAAFLYHGIFRRHYGNQAGSRRLHGIAHMSRVSIYIQLLTMLYNKYFLMALTD